MDSWQEELYQLKEIVESLKDTQESLHYEINFLKKLYYNVIAKLSKTANYSMENRHKVLKIENDRLSKQELNNIAKGIREVFNDVELFDLMLDMGINPNDFTADNPIKRIYDFVLLIHREGRIESLKTHLITKRPLHHWAFMEL